MYDLVGVACTVNGNQEYIDSLRAMYRTIRDDSVPEFKPETVEWKADGTPTLPWAEATKRMAETLMVKKRLECGH